MNSPRLLRNEIFVIVARRTLLRLATLGLVVAALVVPEPWRAPTAGAALIVFVVYVVYYFRTRKALKRAMQPQATRSPATGAPQPAPVPQPAVSAELRSFEIGELMATFREAILALRSPADRAHLSWRDENAHDDWDRLVEAAFDVFVRSAIELDVDHGDSRPLARYDVTIPSYGSLSWIQVESRDGGAGLALVRIEAGDGDFASLWLEDPGANRGRSRRGERQPWTPETAFRYARRDGDGTVTLRDSVTPIE